MKTIDPAAGPRSDTFHYFRDFDNPYFNLCGLLDSTRLTQTTQSKRLGLTVPLFYVALRAANAQSELRQRFTADEVVEFPVVHGGSTVLLQNQSFSFAYFDYQSDFPSFYDIARTSLEAVRKSTAPFAPQDHRQDLIHFSSIPWFAFTSISHARNWRQRDAIPKITFGKNSLLGDRYQIPISVEVHHALVDGYHVGRFLNSVQELMDEVSFL